VRYEVDSLKAFNASTRYHRSVRVLEWIGLLPAIGLCAWMILKFG
jgi:hypothetical protein